MFTKGIWLTTVTPFDEKGDIDETSLRRLTDFYIESGIHGLSLGVLGEVNKLTEEEKERVITILVEQTNKKVPINIVCTEQGTRRAINSANKAEKLGASSVMIAPPNNVNNDKDLFSHYSKIAQNINIPIVVQDDPISTGTKISDSLLAKMANEIDNVRYVKLEDFPSTVKVSNTLSQTNNLKVIGGGARFFYEELSRGAVGTMSSFPFPEILVKIFNLYLNNKRSEAKKLFYKILPLVRYEEILLPIVTDRAQVTKEIFRLRGIIASEKVRHPSTSVDQKTMEEINDIINFLELHV